jgi:Fic family protein
MEVTEPYTPEKLPIEGIDWDAHASLIGKANQYLGRYDGIIQTIVNPDILLAPLMIKEAELSSRIEGTTATLVEILHYEADSKERFTPEKGKEIQEVINYSEAMKFARSELKSRPLTINLIKGMHRILLTGVRGEEAEPGEIRRIQNYITIRGKKIFTPPPPQLVLDALTDWEMYLHKEDRDPLVQLALLKAQFELIHPFKDGNGRIGRMLVPLILYNKGHLSNPTFYISAYLERNRSIYLDRLEDISQKKDWNSWISFFLGAIIE